ncbi:hypothetical protein CDL12_19269 [Handroanthus impetiginosus]|uniref:SANT domain-containing protein n=1 Tax=Handroanthus impetiginosus TaxID=429701 RepID=A0A2G9GS84_9LAMI|nr:hypothetical protein CDL12_19269 [Handroanthus impetiginosus]
MASIPLDKNEDCIDDLHVEQLVSTNGDNCGEAEISDPYYAANIFGEPDIMPRIGEEYQAELPPLRGDVDEMPYLRNHGDTEVSKRFLVGLPIPLKWISMRSKGSDYIVEKRTYSNGDIKLCKEGSPNLPGEEKILKCNGEFLVPGLLGEDWSDAEKASFLLGLYIFEKNFVEVRRFVETKEMGSVLSFYYGKFYGTEEYRRWSKCRKTKSKKCVYGQRIFSGLRQQELLSRLLPKVSEECKSALLEVSKTFGDEKMSLVDYVSSLKAMVGTNVLVEVVGIGKGKQDLTGMALEPPKSNQAIPVRPEIPSGKACSSLTTTEIVKFLSGDYRLSKARSNDLFWEAVWPRLLARGWHSEQPKDQGYIAGSKHCLVFLMPGVKKFSRRKLVKGEQYFDSVTDVLSKVAKEPGLIELDNEEVDGNKNKEDDDSNLSTSEIKSDEDEDDLPTKERHFYLQPRTPNRNTHTIKFMVVDTSLSDGKVRELRTLPSEISNFLISFDQTEDNDEDTVEENSDESNTIIASMRDNPRMSKSGGKVKNHDDRPSYQDARPVCHDISKTSVPGKKQRDLYDDKKHRKVVKAPLKRKRKEGNADHIAPIAKSCQRLTANSHEEMIQSSVGPTVQNGASSVCPEVRDFNENLSSQVSSCQDKLSSTSSSKGSPSESVEFVTTSNIPAAETSTISNVHAAETLTESPETQLLIDINLPQVSQDFENSTKEQDNHFIQPDNHHLPKSSEIEAAPEDQSIMNPRRHSTRNRPLTKKALEALVNGYLTVNRRPKRRDTKSHDNLGSRPSKRTRGVIGPSESTNSSMASHIEEVENGVSNSDNDNTLNKFQVLPNATEESVSGQ